MSSIQVSSVGTLPGATGSEMPVPSLSRMMTLAKLDRRSPKLCQRREEPKAIHIAEPLVEEHEIERALTDGPIADVDIADSSVVGLGRLHRASLV
jgi:hypothetical protein